ncbi:MAG TPA: DUF4266 domain-containing protein [Thermoanaerobaculia bacterium]|nr:DUF4266 domain-containing protein [Thermoanaerobaculia bacterium]
MIRRMVQVCRLMIALALLLSAGCATVHPWDRDLLAEKKMSFIPSPMLLAVDEHIYFSKEASTGGMDAGGGGCGCN